MAGAVTVLLKQHSLNNIVGSMLCVGSSLFLQGEEKSL